MPTNMAHGKVGEQRPYQNDHGVFLPFRACIFGNSTLIKSTFVTYSNAVKIVSSGVSTGFSDWTCAFNISIPSDVIMITNTIKSTLPM